MFVVEHVFEKLFVSAFKDCLTGGPHTEGEIYSNATFRPKVFKHFEAIRSEKNFQ